MIATVQEYLQNVSADKQPHFNTLRQTILDNLPQGFAEEISYGMIGYVVPHSLYAKGYHCNTALPLPFISIAAQKNFIAIYHMGIYADAKLLNWFVSEYSTHCTTKLDMGKSCIRFKKANEIPYELIAQLVQKLTVQQWIMLYETSFGAK